MKSIQNTLGAMAIFAGILAGSMFAEETQTAKSTTQTAAATAAGNTAQNGEKVAVKQANLRKEKTKEELAEEKRLEELREFVKDKKVEKYLLTKRKDLTFIKTADKDGNDVLDVEKTITYLREKEKLAQKIEKDFLIVKGGDIRLAELDAERAIIQEEGEKADKRRAELEEEGRIARANTEKNNAKAAEIKLRADKKLKQVEERLANLAKGINDSKDAEKDKKDINKK